MCESLGCNLYFTHTTTSDQSIFWDGLFDFFTFFVRSHKRRGVKFLLAKICWHKQLLPRVLFYRTLFLRTMRTTAETWRALDLKCCSFYLFEYLLVRLHFIYYATDFHLNSITLTFVDVFAIFLELPSYLLFDFILKSQTFLLWWRGLRHSSNVLQNVRAWRLGFKPGASITRRLPHDQLVQIM